MIASPTKRITSMASHARPSPFSDGDDAAGSDDLFDRSTDRIRALGRLAAAIAVGVSPVTYALLAQRALDVGVGEDEVIGTLIAVAPIVGSSRVVAASPHLAAAVGCDLDSALENSP